MQKKLLTIAAILLLGFLLWRDPVVALCSIGAALLIVLPILSWYEPRLVFYPQFPTRRIESTPNQQGLAFEEINLQTADGETLHAWFIPGGKSPLTVLFLHGNAGNISHRAERFQTFQELGINLFVLDYRGYGQSTGRPHEKGTYLDARAAYDYLLQRGIAAQQIVFYGESLGTAIAVDLAVQVPCGGVILEAPFTSVPDIAQKMFPVLPVRPLVRNRYDTLSKIARLRAPLLIFRAISDEMFAAHHAQRLFTAAPEPKTLVELEGSHSDAFLVSADLYYSELQKFLRGL